MVSNDCEGGEKNVIVGLAFYHLAKKHKLDLEVVKFIDYLKVNECPTEQNEVFKACEINRIILFPPNEKTKNITPVLKKVITKIRGGRTFKHLYLIYIAAEKLKAPVFRRAPLHQQKRSVRP